jgi:hypothetical protein
MLMRAAKSLLCAVVVSNLIISPFATAQQSNSPATNAGSQQTQAAPASASKSTKTKKPTAAPDPTAPPVQPATNIKPSLQSQIAKDATSVFGDVGDYVPCELGRAALLTLRPTPDVITLTAKDEDLLRSQIIAEAEDSTNAAAFPQGQVQQEFFVNSIAQAPLVGLTPSQAAGKVIEILWSATQTDPDATDLRFAAQGSNETFASHVRDKYGFEILNALGSQEQTPQAKLQIAAKVAVDQLSATSQVPEATDLATAASKSNAEFAAVLEKQFGINEAVMNQELAAVGQSPEEKLSVASKLAQNKLSADPKADQLLTAASGTNQDFTKYSASAYSLEPNLGSTEQAAGSKLQALEKVATEDANKEGAQTAKTDVGKAQALAPALTLLQAAEAAQKVVAANSLKDAASQAATAPQGKPSQNQIAQAVQQATAAFLPPKDIACSMSILSYETTRYAFGEKVANAFIPIQIVVRNLNDKVEFLVHDAQVAVDDDINGRYGRYAPGTDKLTTRTYMLSAKDFSGRNLVINIAKGIGTILSSSSLVYGASVKDAANVYSAGFINALLGVLPDHSTDQLNLLNDEGFSSYRTERTVVPKSGTAEFVIFVRSDQFQQGWWVQDCAEKIDIRSEQSLQRDNPKTSARCLGQLNLPNPDSKCLTNTSIPKIGIDLVEARRVCAHVYSHSSGNEPSGNVCASDSEGNASCEPGLVNIGSSRDITGDSAYFQPKKVAYKNWTPRAQAIFRELTLAVVAGIHIQEQTSASPTLTKVDCPVDAAGDVDFDKAANGSVSCPLTGTNLDKLQSLTLKNADQLSDPKTASGTVDPSSKGNATNRNVSFTLDSLGNLSAKKYEVFMETTDGSEVDSGKSVNLGGKPYLPPPPAGKPSPAEIDFADVQKSTAGVTVTVNGYHLDQAQSLDFVSTGTPTKTITKVALTSDSTATVAKVAITSDALKKASISSSDLPLTLTISLDPKASGAAAIPTKETLSLTGTAAPATPSAAPKITTFTPTSGSVGTVVTISGSGLSKTTQVAFGTKAATIMKVVTDKQVTATVPAGAASGKIALTINGNVVKSTASFTVK